MKQHLTDLPDIKRFYLPGFKLETPCPKCKHDVCFNGNKEYLGYPTVGERQLPMYCEACDHEWGVTIDLQVTVEVTAEEARRLREDLEAAKAKVRQLEERVEPIKQLAGIIETQSREIEVLKWRLRMIDECRVFQRGSDGLSIPPEAAQRINGLLTEWSTDTGTPTIVLLSDLETFYNG